MGLQLLEKWLYLSMNITLTLPPKGASAPLPPTAGGTLYTCADLTLWQSLAGSSPVTPEVVAIFERMTGKRYDRNVLI